MLRQQENGAHATIDRILLCPEVCHITGKSRSSIYRGMADQSFPRAIKIGKSQIGFRASEVEAWLRSRPHASYRVGNVKAEHHRGQKHVAP